MSGLQITTSPIEVRIDGGSSPGKLVVVDGKLSAVIVHLSPADGEGVAAEGWFLEAGFGPCGPLLVTPPGVFATEAAALEWISRQVERARPVDGVPQSPG